MNKSESLEVYYRMKLCRDFETRVAEQYSKGRIGGFCRLNAGDDRSVVSPQYAGSPNGGMA